MADDYPEFSLQTIEEGWWEIYHDDDCGETLVDGRCPKCGFVPDMQSLGARKTNGVKKPLPEIVAPCPHGDYKTCFICFLYAHARAGERFLDRVVASVEECTQAGFVLKQGQWVKE